jgi:hypothetical protein
MSITGELYLKIGRELEAAKKSLRFWTFGLAEAELEYACKNHSVHHKIYESGSSFSSLEVLMKARKKAKATLTAAQGSKESWEFRVRTLSILYSSLAN